MSSMLQKSEINLNCNLKSIEILAPDNINYEMSKFLILQTGDIHLRSGESKRMNLFFSQSNQPRFLNDKYHFKNKIEEHLKLLPNEENFQKELFTDEYSILQNGGSIDKYSFMIYDLKVLYIPTVDQLENYMYNDTF